MLRREHALDDLKKEEHDHHGRCREKQDVQSARVRGVRCVFEQIGFGHEWIFSGGAGDVKMRSRKSGANRPSTRIEYRKNGSGATPW